MKHRTTPSVKLPEWAQHWQYWGLAIGSGDRYVPRWYERRAYFMGMRDAARIVEFQRYDARLEVGTSPLKFGRTLIRVLHRQVFARLFDADVTDDQLPPGL